MATTPSIRASFDAAPPVGELLVRARHEWRGQGGRSVAWDFKCGT